MTQECVALCYLIFQNNFNIVKRLIGLNVFGTGRHFFGGAGLGIENLYFFSGLFVCIVLTFSVETVWSSFPTSEVMKQSEWNHD